MPRKSVPRETPWKCASCETLIFPEARRGKPRQYCSFKCRPVRAYVYDPQRTPEQISRGIENSRARYRRLNPVTQVCCLGCSVTFTREIGDLRLKYCSEKCRLTYKRRLQQNSGKTHKRRAQRFGVEYSNINRLDVFERDGWMCRLCGSKTPRELMGKGKPTSPEIDHIIPLSQGGGHVMTNVQCACHQCNMKKRDRPLGQLLMWG